MCSNCYKATQGFVLILSGFITTTEENKCHPNPCHNGGTCTEANGGYVCTCNEGYKGTECEGKETRGEVWVLSFAFRYNYYFVYLKLTH